ncbi:hypothetical protein D3C78_799460 [compost metagenome]
MKTGLSFDRRQYLNGGLLSYYPFQTGNQINEQLTVSLNRIQNFQLPYLYLQTVCRKHMVN